MAVRTVTVEMRLNATSFLADGRAVVRVNNDMSDSLRRLTTDATAASHATDDMSRNVRQLGNRARIAENRVRELREEIDRLTAAALAASGPINIINGPGGGGGSGARMGGGFFRMLTRAFMALPPELQLAVIAAGTALAVLFATAFGAMVSGLLISALELVLIGGFVALAAKSSNLIQHEFMSTFSPIVAEVLNMALALEGPVVSAIRIMGAAWDSMAPKVRNLVQILAGSGSIEALAAGLGNLVANLLPGFETALSSGVVKEFGRDLGMLGTALSSMVMSLTRSQGAVKGIRTFMMLLSGTIMIVGVIVGWLSDKFDVLTNVLGAVTDAASRIPVIGGLFAEAADKWAVFNDTTEGGVRNLKDTGTAATQAGQGLDRTGQGARDAEKALARLNETMERTAHQMLALSNARLDVNQGLIDLRKSFEENGRTLNDHTEKGIANLRMVNQQVAAAQAARDAFIEQNKATLGVAEATRQANAIFAQDVAAIQAVLRAAGLTAAQINALTAQWMAWVNSPNANKSSTITTYYRTDGKPPPAGGRTPGYAPGVHNFNREGGLYMARKGLVNLSGQAAMFRPGATKYGFAEQNTGGEAFIARNADHGRSLAIANQAASWHGGMVVTGGGGGGHRGGPAVQGAGAGNGAGIATRAVLDLLKYAFNGPIRATVDAGGRVRIT